MVHSSFGNITLTDEAVNLFKDSGLTKLQEFYGLSFEDMFSDEIMELRKVKPEDLEYIKTHREVEFARKESETWEMKANLFKNPEWIRIKEFYGINESDIRSADILKQKGLKDTEIEFIIGWPIKNKEQEKIQKIKESIKEVESNKKKKWMKKQENN